MRYTFGGEQAVTYAQYLDLDAGHTLVAEPGGTYTIAQAAGQPLSLPVPPDDRWTKATAKAAKDHKES